MAKSWLVFLGGTFCAALAAPVLAADGGIVAALMLAGPVARMQANAKDNEKLLMQAAAECTRMAGGVPAVPA